MTPASRLTLLWLLSAIVLAQGFTWIDTEDSAQTCIYDSFDNDGNCTCQNRFNSGQHCEEWSCMNYGRGLPLTDFTSSSQACDCPAGFQGFFCEPVGCPQVPDAGNAFNFVDRSFSVLVTWNDDMRNLVSDPTKPDDIQTALMDMAKNPAITALDSLKIWLLGSDGSQMQKCPEDGSTDFSACVKDAFDIAAFSPGSIFTLTAADIQAMLEQTSTGSPLLILTNVGLTNYTDSELLRLTRSAIARQIDVTVVLVNQQAYGQNYFHYPAFVVLKNLAEDTLGTFITPYTPMGQLFVPDCKSQDVVKMYGPLLAAKNLVAVSSFVGDNFLLPTKLFAPSNQGGDIYVGITNPDADNGISPSVMSVFSGNPFESFLNVSRWQLFKLPFTTSVDDYNILITKASSTFAKRVVVITVDRNMATQINQPRAFLGYTIDDVADATAPLPLAKVPNQVVAHVRGLTHPTITATLMNITATSQRRPCLFDSLLTTITSDDDTVRGIVTLTTNSSFQQSIPFIFSTAVDTQVNTKVDNSALFRDLQRYEEEDDDNSHVCSSQASGTLLLDPKQPRTMSVLILGYKSLTSALIPGLLGDQTFFSLLRGYYQSYDSSFFKNFVSHVFSATQHAVPLLSTSYAEFQRDIATKLQNAVADADGDCDATAHAKAISDALDDMEPFSEAFVITNKRFGNDDLSLNAIYKKLEEKRIKVNFVLYAGACSAFTEKTDVLPFYDIARRSGGVVVPVNNKNYIESFFNAYKSVEKSALAFSNYQDSNEFIGGVSTTTFQYVKGTQYVYTTSVVMHEQENMPTILISDTTGNIVTMINVTMIGTSFAMGSLPEDLASNTYRLRVVTLETSPVFLTTLREMNGIDFPVVFTTSSQTDAAYLYPVFVGVGHLSVVAHVGELATFAITQKIDRIVHSTTATNNRTECFYDEIMDSYQWLCTEANGVYYVKVETENATRSSIFTCYSSESGGQCQNSGVLVDGICVCRPGFEGSNCETPVCFNGGTLEVGDICRCTAEYTGVHCEQSTVTCQSQPAFPRYTADMNTFVLILDGALFPTTGQLSDVIGDWSVLYPVFSEYILVTSYQMNGDVTDAQVYKTKEGFLKGLAVAEANVSPSSVQDVRPTILKALQSIHGDRSLVIWLSQFATCTTYNPIDDGLVHSDIINMFAKTRAELRAFTKQGYVPAGSCLTAIASLGGGVPVVMNTLSDIPTYVNKIIPDTAFTTYEYNRLKSLVTHDVYVTDTCEGEVISFIPATFGIDADVDKVYLTVMNYVVSPSTSAIAGSNIYELDVTTSYTLTGITKDTTPFCGYLVESKSSRRIAYQYTPSPYFQTDGFAVSYADEFTNLNMYIDDFKPTAIVLSKFPEVWTSPFDILTFKNFSYEHSPVVSRDCTYPWSIELNCNGEEGLLRTKVLVPAATPQQRILTTYCLKNTPCSSHGVQLGDDGACVCDPMWSGTTCSIPTCMNGGTPNHDTCSCPDDYYGSNCQNSDVAKLASRNIMLLFDVTGFIGIDDSLLADRKKLAIDFLITYNSTTTAKFALAFNNKADGTLPLGSSFDQVVAKINAIALSNFTAAQQDLTSAFKFFNQQDFSAPVEFRALSAIFYITTTPPPPKQDLTVVKELQSKDVYVFSGYYSHNSPDPRTLQELMMLGGVTGYVNSYYTIKRFQDYLLGNASNNIPTPPPTTTAPPHENVYYRTLDIIVYMDAIGMEPFKDKIVPFLMQFGQDLNFVPVTDDEKASRLSVGVVKIQIPTMFCGTTKASYENIVSQTDYKPPAANATTDMNSEGRVLNVYFGNNIRGARKVPQVFICITSNPIASGVNTTLFTDTLAHVQKFMVLLDLGNTDFSGYKDISRNIYTITTSSDMTTFKTNIYNDIVKATAEPFDPALLQDC